jgi:hypothetical protein
LLEFTTAGRRLVTIHVLNPRSAGKMKGGFADRTQCCRGELPAVARIASLMMHVAPSRAAQLLPASACQFVRRTVLWCAGLTLLVLPSSPATVAAPVGTVAGYVPNTTVNPALYVPPVGQPDWTGGDPGWNNVAIAGRQAVYLGDGWVLGARHVGVGGAITFETPGGSVVANPMGSAVIVRNPPPSQTGGLVLDTLQNGETDLLMYRIDVDPGLPGLQIASRSDPLPAAADIVTVGRGRVRQTNKTIWYAVTSGDDWTWSETAPPGSHEVFEGYKTSPSGIKRWGTNGLVDPESEAIADAFEGFLSDTTGVLQLRTADGRTRNVISMVTIYDDAATEWEVQSVSGDSGSAVFYNYGDDETPDWHLAGIINAALTYNNQPSATAIFGRRNGPAGPVIPGTGNATVVSDLSYYNEAYSRSICDIMRACGNYSIIGDVNIDGLLDEADVNAFVAGWMYDNGAGKGDYLSWTLGDLNLDGQTNVQDFLLLRGALNAAGAGAALDNIDLNSISVPEPATLALLMAAAAMAAACRRERSGRQSTCPRSFIG